MARVVVVSVCELMVLFLGGGLNWHGTSDEGGVLYVVAMGSRGSSAVGQADGGSGQVVSAGPGVG